MAKWGTGYRWGSGTLWGQAGGGGMVSVPFSGEIVWIINIDWTGNGAINENAYIRQIDINRGREHYLNPSGSGFEKMQPGKATLVFDNSNGRYNPYNVDSPLYGDILPGRKIQILAYIVATKKTEVRFTGHITDLQPSADSKEVTITAEDGMRWLEDAEYSSGVIYSRMTFDAINLVLSFVNWPYQRNIQPSFQPLQVFEPGSGSSLSIIQQLAEANLGTFFIDRYGKAIFYPVNYLITTSHDIDESILLREIRISQPWETVRNKIKIIANRKGKRPESNVWTMAGIETFTAGQTKSFGATFKSSDGLSIEYLKANTAIDGTGNDVSDNFTVTKSDITSTNCTLSVTYNGTGTAYLLGLFLVGSAIVSAPESKTASDSTSILKYGPRSFTLDNPWLQDRSYAAAYASILNNHLKDPHKDPIIQIQQYPSVQYAIDLYDKINLTSATLGIDDTYTVAGIREKWLSDTGQNAVTTLYLQNVLYDSTIITPDPFYPGALPDVPFEDMPSWIDPWIPENNSPIIDPFSNFPVPDMTDFCLRTDADQTNAYPVTFTRNRLLNDNDNQIELESFLWFPCTLRTASSLNKSTMIVHGGWSYTNASGVQNYDILNSWWHVDAIASDKSVLCSGSIVNGYTSPRNVIFSPTTALEVAGFRIWIDKKGIYGIGTEFASGSIPVTDDNGTTVPGLTIGNYYCVEGYGGPWCNHSAFPSQLFWGIGIIIGGTYYVIGGDSYLGYNSGIASGKLLQVDNAFNNGKYGRGYWKAENTSEKIVITDPTKIDNSGSMNFIVRNSSLAGKKLMTINNIFMKNVCGTGIL
ncbi:MAG: hypothetical protein WC107_05590 [Patescibacteria group bacterium]|jgi:hypothetical protein